jgi:hypothetical protein
MAVNAVTRRDWLLLMAGAGALYAQREPGYDRSVVQQTRIDLRDLGYPPEDVIPSDECAIRALAVAPDGALYGATSGTKSHLFVLHPQHGYVQPLGVLPEITTVHRGLAVSDAGDVYIGGSIGVDNNGAGYDKYAGAPLLRYTPRNEERGMIQIGRRLETKNLGIPVAGEGVYNLGIDRRAGVVYGTSYPGGWFFSYGIAENQFTQHGQLAQRRIQGERFENERAIGRALAIDAEGNVFTSGEGGHLYRFSPKSKKLEALGITLPGVPGREAYNRVDAWATSPEGSLYGGTSDGYLFRLDTARREAENLGKPLNQYRVRGLAFAGGKLYGVGGDDDEMARLFSYDPARGVYRLLGMVDVNHRPYYAWQAYVIDSVAAGLDGTIYLGQAERKSKLYLYYPS